MLLPDKLNTSISLNSSNLSESTAVLRGLCCNVTDTLSTVKLASTTGLASLLWVLTCLLVLGAVLCCLIGAEEGGVDGLEEVIPFKIVWKSLAISAEIKRLNLDKLPDNLTWGNLLVTSSAEEDSKAIKSKFISRAKSRRITFLVCRVVIPITALFWLMFLFWAVVSWREENDTRKWL